MAESEIMSYRWLLWGFRGVIFHVHMHLYTKQQGNIDIQSKATNVYIIVQAINGLTWLMGNNRLNQCRNVTADIMREELFAMLRMAR